MKSFLAELSLVQAAEMDGVSDENSWAIELGVLEAEEYNTWLRVLEAANRCGKRVLLLGGPNGPYVAEYPLNTASAFFYI